jgi:hypothetical protein
VPLALRQAQTWVDAWQSDLNFDDAIAAVHQAFMRQWQTIQLDAKDNQHLA